MQAFLLSPEMFVRKLHGGYRRLLGVDVSPAAREEWVLTAERHDESHKSGLMPRTDEEQAIAAQPVRKERIDNSTICGDRKKYTSFKLHEV